MRVAILNSRCENAAIAIIADCSGMLNWEDWQTESVKAPKGPGFPGSGAIKSCEPLGHNAELRK